MKHFWGVYEKVRFLFYSDTNLKEVSIVLYLIVSWLIQRGSLLTSIHSGTKDTLWLVLKEW